MLVYRYVILSLLALSAAFLTGCGGDSITYSRGRMVNALVGVQNTTNDPKGPGIDFLASRQNASARNVPFGGVSAFFTVPHGDLAITVYERGTQKALLPTQSVDFLP